MIFQFDEANCFGAYADKCKHGECAGTASCTRLVKIVPTRSLLISWLPTGLMNPMGVVSLSGELKEALTNTDQMYFEVNKAAYRESINDAKKLADGKTLLSLLTPAQQTKLNAFLKKYMEVDFRSSYVQKKYGNLTPAALMEDMEQLLFVANHMGMYDPTHTFDQYFEAQAKANNETVGGLSDVDAYINATYKSDLKQQVARLVEFLENEPTELAKLNKAVGAFKAQDVDAAAKATGAHVSQATLEAWAAKVQTVMAEKPTFFVVDAANLGGGEWSFSSCSAMRAAK